MHYKGYASSVSVIRKVWQVKVVLKEITWRLTL